MPLVVVARNPKVISDRLLSVITKNLPSIVASALDCDDEGGSLTSRDVEVWVQDFGPNDINTKDLEIVVWANQYPQRLRHLNARRADIVSEIRSIRGAARSNFTGFVWVLLQPASFGEI